MDFVEYDWFFVYVNLEVLVFGDVEYDGLLYVVNVVSMFWW